MPHKKFMRLINILTIVMFGIFDIAIEPLQSCLNSVLYPTVELIMSHRQRAVTSMFHFWDAFDLVLENWVSKLWSRDRYHESGKVCAIPRHKNPKTEQTILMTIMIYSCITVSQCPMIPLWFLFSSRRNFRIILGKFSFFSNEKRKMEGLFFFK